MERKKTHKFYSASFKLKVVGVAEQIGKHKASTQFNVDRKHIREWCKSKDSLQALKGRKRRGGGGGAFIRTL